MRNSLSFRIQFTPRRYYFSTWRFKRMATSSDEDWCCRQCCVSLLWIEHVAKECEKSVSRTHYKGIMRGRRHSPSAALKELRTSNDCISAKNKLKDMKHILFSLVYRAEPVYAGCICSCHILIIMTRGMCDIYVV